LGKGTLGSSRPGPFRERVLGRPGHHRLGAGSRRRGDWEQRAPPLKSTPVHKGVNWEEAPCAALRRRTASARCSGIAGREPGHRRAGLQAVGGEEPWHRCLSARGRACRCYGRRARAGCSDGDGPGRGRAGPAGAQERTPGCSRGRILRIVRVLLSSRCGAQPRVRSGCSVPGGCAAPPARHYPANPAVLRSCGALRGRPQGQRAALPLRCRELRFEVPRRFSASTTQTGTCTRPCGFAALALLVFA